MNFIFPFLYATILFVSLSIIGSYLVGLLQMTQKVEQRISVYERRLQLNQNPSETSFKLGQLYLRKKLYPQAITLFRKSLTLWNLNDEIGLGSLYNTLGFTYFKLKQYEHAVYYYNHAINLLPDYTLARTNLALVYETNQMYQEACNIYASVLIYEKTNKIVESRLPVVELKAGLTI